MTESRRADATGPAGRVRLRSDRLPHLNELRIDPALLDGRFARACATRHCDASCCRVGVWVDLGHRDLVLAHAARVRRAMDPDQEHDPARWFGATEADDADFPSGRAVDTVVRDGRCVFLNRAGRCVLQAASLGEGRRELDLKPFLCAAYPIVVLDCTLTIEDEFPGHPRCCSPTSHGRQAAVDAFGPELRYVVGEAGVDELRHRARPATGPVG